MISDKQREFYERFVKTKEVNNGKLSYTYETVEGDPKDIWDFIDTILKEREKETIGEVLEMINDSFSVTRPKEVLHYYADTVLSSLQANIRDKYLKD